METGNLTQPDYTSVGQSLDFMSWDSTQSTLFYTSTMNVNGLTYSFINTVEIMKLYDPQS